MPTDKVKGVPGVAFWSVGWVVMLGGANTEMTAGLLIAAPNRLVAITR